MVRIKRGMISLKKRRSLLKRVKGFRWGRSTKERQAREAILHAGNHAFAHRRKKKGDFRNLWQIQISAALRKYDTPYNTFIHSLKQKNILLNRKVLKEIAQEHPEAFGRIVTHTK